jgi:uncharacterized protein (DUF433 family)
MVQYRRDATMEPSVMAEQAAPRRLDPAGVVVSDPDIAGGEPIFRGTRVPVATLFEQLEEGVGLAEILADFPTLERTDVLTVLREAHSLVVGQELQRAAE